jgi:formylglycine-generating enzyme required for sulfatase activity
MKIAVAIAVASAVLSCTDCAKSAVNFNWANVGNPGNAPDDTGYGAVDYNYRISRHEVTNAQYVEFLNAVAASDPNRLYETNPYLPHPWGIVRSGDPGEYTYSVKPDFTDRDGVTYSYPKKPVFETTFLRAVRFVNWLENGQPTGPQGPETTEDGSYRIEDGMRFMRNPTASFFLPTDDEWYKAAYHKNDGVTGNYWDYPTSADLAPTESPPWDDSGNSGNFRDAISRSYYPLTDVGAYQLSRSPYGTFDQGGNVDEWTETSESVVISLPSTGRIARGGSWFNGPGSSAATRRGSFPAAFRIGMGFRVASIPEPGGIILSVLACTSLLARRNRSS